MPQKNDPWTDKDISTLKMMSNGGFAPSAIAERLGRSRDAVNSKIRKLSGKKKPYVRKPKQAESVSTNP